MSIEVLVELLLLETYGGAGEFDILQYCGSGGTVGALIGKIILSLTSIPFTSRKYSCDSVNRTVSESFSTGLTTLDAYRSSERRRKLDYSFMTTEMTLPGNELDGVL